MTKRKTIAGLAGLVSLLTLPLLHSTAAPDTPAQGTAVRYRTIGTADFQSFIKNWDDKQEPALYALIRTPAEWTAVFHPAPVMGKHKSFAPADAEFEKEQLLVIARVMFPPDGDMAKVFRVEEISVSGEELVFSYKFDEPKAPKSYSIKNYLGVWVPRRAVGKVVFVENGQRVGVLDVSRGQWSVPTMIADQPLPNAGGGK
jgi:hypothetical protein